MPNSIPVLIEQRILAFSLGHPGLGPRRISAELARPLWGSAVSPAGVWRVLARHGLGTRSRRLALIAGYAAPPEPQHVEPAEERHLDVSHPGELVQMDAFCIGRLAGTKGVVWQYTAIDAASRGHPRTASGTCFCAPPLRTVCLSRLSPPACRCNERLDGGFGSITEA